MFIVHCSKERRTVSMTSFSISSIRSYSALCFIISLKNRPQCPIRPLYGRLACAPPTTDPIL